MTDAMVSDHRAEEAAQKVRTLLLQAARSGMTGHITTHIKSGTPGSIEVRFVTSHRDDWTVPNLSSDR